MKVKAKRKIERKKASSPGRPLPQPVDNKNRGMTPLIQEGELDEKPTRYVPNYLEM